MSHLQQERKKHINTASMTTSKITSYPMLEPSGLADKNFLSIRWKKRQSLDTNPTPES